MNTYSILPEATQFHVLTFFNVFCILTVYYYTHLLSCAKFYAISIKYLHVNRSYSKDRFSQPYFGYNGSGERMKKPNSCLEINCLPRNIVLYGGRTWKTLLHFKQIKMQFYIYVYITILPPWNEVQT